MSLARILHRTSENRIDVGKNAMQNAVWERSVQAIEHTTLPQNILILFLFEKKPKKMLMNHCCLQSN